MAGRRRPTLSCATGLSLPLVRDVLREHVGKVRRSSASCLSISNPCSFRALADTRGCLLRRGRMTTMKGVFAIHFVSYESMRWLHPPPHSMTSMRSGSPYLIHLLFRKKNSRLLSGTCPALGFRSSWHADVSLHSHQVRHSLVLSIVPVFGPAWFGVRLAAAYGPENYGEQKPRTLPHRVRRLPTEAAEGYRGDKNEVVLSSDDQTRNRPRGEKTWFGYTFRVAARAHARVHPWLMVSGFSPNRP